MTTTIVDINEVIAHLEECSIRPSASRIAVMKYVMEHAEHPTVDIIYRALSPQYPTLSRTTVYNTLWLLVERGALMALDIDRTNARFDYIRHPHAHFMCRKCGCIIDVDIEMTRMPVPNVHGLEIDEVNVYYKGYCCNCTPD